MKFSIIIPTIKATTLIKDCVDTIYKHEPDKTKYEILVVDDGSDKHIQKWLSVFCGENSIRLFLKDRNLGFSHSVNMGLRNGVGEYLILVNNDIEFTKPFLDDFEKAFNVHKDIGIVGAKLVYPDKRIQHAGVVRIPKSHSFSHINKFAPSDIPSVNQSKYFLSVTGALFGISRTAFKMLGDFNENYFIACEDCEYCLRAWKKGLRVYYSHEIEAVHIEGYTRGNDNSSKLKKGPEWYRKEKETYDKFRRDLGNYNLDLLDLKVIALNRGDVVEEEIEQLDQQIIRKQPKKLEIGCGVSPLPGYLHLDVRKLPDVEYVCDFSKEKLPFENGDLDEIVLNHAIEHVSWRSLPFIFQEWNRTLAPGGRVFLRTPDLEFICKTYLEGKTTPEFHPDENFIRNNFTADITPSWWANIKLFAGQDYPSNFHFLCFDFKTLKEVFERFGFEKVSRLNIQPVYSPGELQVEAFKKGEPSLNVKPLNLKILVKRKGALGDVVLTTPIVRNLREKVGKKPIINVATDCGIIFKSNPDVNNVFAGNHSVAGYDQVIDLDLAYERSPEKHIIEAYGAAAFGDFDIKKSNVQTSLYPSTEEDAIGSEIFVSRGLNPKKTIVIHPGVTWKNRTWPKESWDILVKNLVSDGFNVIAVGSGSDFKIEGGCFNLVSLLTVHVIAAVISKCACFVGIDSGILHIAGTTTAPIVGLFTSAKSEYRLPFRNGELGYNCKAVVADIPCVGCLHKEKPPVVYCDCKRGDYACISKITPDKVLEAIRGMCAS